MATTTQRRGRLRMTQTDSPKGSSIRDRRIAVGLSQDRLARLAGCSLAMIQALERGYVPVRSAVVPRVERVLDALASPDNEQRPGAQNPAVAKADDAGPQSA